MAYHRKSESNCSSPQYQAVATPTRSSAPEIEEIVRTRSHSHALSSILGANNNNNNNSSSRNSNHSNTTPNNINSGRASTSVDWRPSSSHPLQLANSTAQLTAQISDNEEDEKTELPLRLTTWRRSRRRWKKILLWLGALFVFVACFLMSFAAPRQVQTLAPITLGAGLSLLATLLVLVSFLRRRRLRRRPNELLAFVALSEFGLALLTMIQVVTMCSADNGECRPIGMATCRIVVSFEMFLLLAGVGWFGAAIVHLFVSVSNPFASYKRQLVLYHLVVWGFSLVASVATPLALFTQRTQDKFELSGTEVCRAVVLVLPLLPSDAEASTRSRTERLAQWQELNLEFWGFLVAIVVLVVVSAQLILVVGWWRSNSGTIIALKARRRLMKRMTIYVHALNATWLVLLVIFFIYRSNANALAYVQVEGEPPRIDGGINFLDALFHFVLTGKGFITGVVWLSVNKPCCAFGLVFCGLHQCKEDDEVPSLGASALASSQSVSLSGSSNGESRAQRMNQSALLTATVISVEAGVLAPPEMPMLSPTSTVLAFEAHESVRESGILGMQERRSLPSLSTVMEPPSTARSSRSSSSSYDASTVESYEASQNNETLQREIIYYTVCGITKAIIRSAERARSSSVTTGDIAAVLGDEDTANLTMPNRDGGLVETTLFVGAERDSTLVNNSFISHVQNVSILSSPRAYCKPRVPLPAIPVHRAVFGDQGNLGGSGSHIPRPTSFTTLSTLDCPGNWRQPPHLQHSRSQGSPQGSRLRMSATFHNTPGRFSLYPVSQVPFELFEQEIELQSNRSSVDEPSLEGRSTRSAVFAGLRRTATSAFSQGRGVFRSRSGSTEAAMSATSTSSAVDREFLPDDPKPKVFVDYAPREFRAIRLAFGLSDEKYLASFRTTAKERVSSGSSGAFMFFSGDNSLLVKSLKEKECRALVDMAPEYAKYLTANPHSRLIRFFGCHRVRLYGRNFYFAVMSNVLHSENHTDTITEKYDVKGSWVDRRARRPQRGDRVTCAECDANYVFGGNEEGDTPNAAGNSDDGRASAMDDRTVSQFPFHVHRPDIVFKDLDLERSLQLPRHIATHLHAQIVSDCEFLRDVGIMDYSLLIGIHKCHLRAPRPDRSTEVHATTSADFEEAFNRELHLLDDPTNSGTNLAPIGDDEVYFVGIIDILQQWDWEKQLEKAGKVLLGKSSRGISALAPAAYCRRFQARCTQILLGGPAPDDLDQDWEIDPTAVDVKETKSRPNSKKNKEMVTASLIIDNA
nr:Phytopthora agathidicda GPCR-PIPK 9 [Phytophthora agathidicida]